MLLQIPMTSRLFLSVLTATWCAAGASVAAISETEARRTCDQAAAFAARKSSVPVEVLKAVTRTETGIVKGGQLVPWPWTVNMEGKGVWFESPDAALSFAFKRFKLGARSFDVGCFQINYKWHHEAFGSLEEMFDPTANALYAARFLEQLFSEFGSWDKAVGAFHSRTPKYARRYMAHYRKHFAAVTSAETRQQETASAGGRVRKGGNSENAFPLLVNRVGSRSSGSLVPLAERRAVSLFARAKPVVQMP